MLPGVRLYDCCMEEAYVGGLSVVSKYELGRRLQGLSGVGIVFVSETIIELCTPFLVASLVVRKLAWNPLQPRTPPPKSMGLFVFLFAFNVDLYVPFPPSVGPYFLAFASTFFFFFVASVFCPDGSCNHNMITLL